MAIRLLNSSAAIRTAIHRTLNSQGERIVLVAFVGSGADRYIPHPEGLRLVCWDKPGCTDPDAIRSLINRGADVYFASDLHMKLFWSSTNGAVIGSANLSENGLGDHGLSELGVHLSSDAVTAERLFALQSKRKATAEALDDLEKRTIAYKAANRGKLVFGARRRVPVPSFHEWLTAKSRKSWRLFAYDYASLTLNPAAQKRLAADGYGDAEDYWTGDSGQSEPNTWLLSVHLKHGGRGISWACADFRLKLSRNDPQYTRRWPYFAVQLHPQRFYGRVPFRLTPAVKNAVREALRKALIRDDKAAQAFAPGGAYPSSLLDQMDSYLSTPAHRRRR